MTRALPIALASVTSIAAVWLGLPAPSSQPDRGEAAAAPDGPPAPAPPGRTSALPAATASSSAWRATADTPRYVAVVDGDRVELRAPDGTPLLDLAPTLRVALAPPDGPPSARPRRPRPTTARFALQPVERRADGGWTLVGHATVDAATYGWRLEHRPADPRLRFTLTGRYDARRLARVESIRLHAHARRASVLGSDYRPHRVRRTAFVDELTPRLAWLHRGATSVVVEGGRGVQGMWVRRARGGFDLELEAEHEDNHPLVLHDRCTARATDDTDPLVLAAADREAGSGWALHGSVVLGDASLLRPGRFPRGYAAALALTDHADQSSADKLEALAFGRAGALAAGEVGPAYPGFVNQGLAYTKTVFAQAARHYAPQLDDPRFLAVAEAMAARGVELGLHSPTGLADERPRAAALLDAVGRALSARTEVWIDHQPNTNCEAISNRGWDADDRRWYVLDLLAASGVRYLWSGRDVSLRGGSLNQLDPRRGARRRPTLFDHDRLDTAGGASFRLFTTAWLFESRRRLLRRLSGRALDRLQDERGLLLGHTYLDTYRPGSRMARRTLLEPDRGGGLRLRADVAARFAELGARQRDGALWVTGVARLGDHLRGALALELEYLPGGLVEVRGPPGVPLADVTLLLPDPQARLSVTIDGAAPDGARHRDGTTEAWFDLPADQPRRLAVLDGAAPAALVVPAIVSLEVVADGR